MDRSNISESIRSKIGRNLYMIDRHPVQIIKQKIFDYFGDDYTKFENMNPYVSIVDNFDLLLIPENHPSRSRSDTYYLTDDIVLRTHTSAHQNELLAKGYTKFLVAGDVYRKDEINATHYPVFHQMEGVCVVDDDVDPTIQLQKVLSGLVEYLYPGNEYRFNPDYFPFTDPSFEVEVKFGDKWVEILGCGVMQPKILEHNNITKRAWAFGLGLERLAMIQFGIPDIRYFWTDDEKFLSQFRKTSDIKFVPYSKLDKIYKDISFWINESEINSTDTDSYEWSRLNNYYELIREICGDNIESVDLYDKYKNIKTSKLSHTFRLTFSPNTELADPSAFNAVCNELMTKLRTSTSEFGVQLR